MRMRTKFKFIPKRPRYSLVRKIVIETILRYSSNVIPINLTDIINFFPDLDLRSYCWYEKTMKVNRKYIISKLTKSNEGGLLNILDDFDNANYMILYNESEKLGRKRFTIAHEIGHYLLEHNKLIKGTVLSRGEFLEKEYEVLEKEANFFARMLLVPLPILSYINKNWGVINRKILTEIFCVSYAVAGNVISHINKQIFWGFILTNKKMVNKYRNSLNQYINIHICTNCNAEFVLEGPIHCPICNADSITRIMSSNYEIYLEFERSDYMIYEGVELDKNSKAVICPVCQNEEPQDGEYCSICGKHLVNRCTNVDGPWRSSNDGPTCGVLLLGNARYCTYCGTESTFLNNEILKPWDWDIETEDIETEIEIEIAEKDIPF